MRDFLTVNGSFDQLSVSNLVQFIPSCFSVDFEQERAKRPVESDTEGRIMVTFDEQLNFRVGELAFQRT
jgi:hypothetical protein